MPTAVDIFCGGGGLTVGLKRAGFNVVGAIELDPHAFSTYKANHPKTHVYKQDVRTIEGKDLIKLSPSGSIDLLSGCPPCQGFSTLTAKYKRTDPRNDLISEMGRLIKEIRPKMVMMENVPGLVKKGKPLFDQFLNLLISLKYVPDYNVLQVADYGVPQNRRRLVLLAGLGFPVKLPRPLYAKNGDGKLSGWRSVESVLKGSSPPLTLAEANSMGGPQLFNWHVVRTLSPENELRIKAAKPGRNWTSIPRNMRPECHKNPNTGFCNVYGRMSWNAVAPTITGGCTTFSKGRFGHPVENRTISVREAAIIQTFPSNYIFDTPYMDHACNIIGNALPCDFAEVLAKQCIKAAKKYC